MKLSIRRVTRHDLLARYNMPAATLIVATRDHKMFANCIIDRSRIVEPKFVKRALVEMIQMLDKHMAYKARPLTPEG